MTVTENDRLSNIKKRFQRRLLQSDAKNANAYIPTYQLLIHFFFNILREKACFLLRIFVSLHRQSKEQSSCAKSRSSMKTEAGLNRWQAPVINEDHKNGQETAFWGIVIQGTLKRRQSMTNKT